MNVTIEDSCIACGACESICDAVFSIEDKAVVDSSAVSGNEDGVIYSEGNIRWNRNKNVVRCREELKNEKTVIYIFNIECDVVFRMFYG